jgi:hypothetical protein
MNRRITPVFAEGSALALPVQTIEGEEVVYGPTYDSEMDGRGCTLVGLIIEAGRFRREIRLAHAVTVTRGDLLRIHLPWPGVVVKRRTLKKRLSRNRRTYRKVGRRVRDARVGDEQMDTVEAALFERYSDATVPSPLPGERSYRGVFRFELGMG